MHVHIYAPVEFVEHDHGCTAEVEIRVGGKTVGYLGGSRYINGLRADAERIVSDVFFDLIGKRIADHPEVRDAR